MIEEDKVSNPETMDELVAAEVAERARLANRPMIDHLPDAIEKDTLGRLVLKTQPGEKLIIERLATILQGKPWLDTKTYTVVSIDEATGKVSLWDDDLHRSAMTNYMDGLKAGYRFKMQPKKAPPIGGKRRGRPRKNPLVEKPVEQEKKKRGRPAGSKNRPSELIAAEKRAKLESRRNKK